ncbi:MAG TPA: B-box zinc finger protein [Terriglobales bacterium]|nr:B-box zinc finger protein [Terriglobales bacterium]
MNCATHQQTPAIAYCRTCGKPLCESCKREVRGIIYCEDCLASRVQAEPDSMNPKGPNPWVAFALGFIPGVGAMYSGEFKKAFIHVAVFVALVVAANEASDYFALGFPFWFFYMAFDSYQTAKAKREGRPVPDVFGFSALSAAPAAAPNVPTTSVPPLLDPKRSQNLPLGPLVLIALGVLFLLHTMGLIPHFFHLAKLWPLILLAIGGSLIYQRSQRMICHCVACTAISLMGPVILVTIGIMGLLDEFTPVRWKESWPLILIVIGVLKFLQITGSREGHIEREIPRPVVPPPDTPTTPSSQNEVSHG